MPDRNVYERGPDERFALLEWRAAETAQQLERLRIDNAEKLESLNARLGRILFAGWALIASILGGATAMVLAAIVLRGH